MLLLQQQHTRSSTRPLVRFPSLAVFYVRRGSRFKCRFVIPLQPYSRRTATTGARCVRVAQICARRYKATSLHAQRKRKVDHMYSNRRVDISACLRACRACVCVHWLDDTETQREGGEEGEDQTFSPRAEEQQVKVCACVLAYSPARIPWAEAHRARPVGPAALRAVDCGAAGSRPQAYSHGYECTACTCIRACAN